MSKKQLERVRRICLAFPETSERLSHGEPTFFVHKKVFAMFSNNHHSDGHVAILVPTPPGMQAVLLEKEPKTFYRPPYVGVSGWVGIELSCVSDEDLAFHLKVAWELIAPERLKANADEPVAPLKAKRRRSIAKRKS